MKKKMLTMMTMVALWAGACYGWSSGYEGAMENVKEGVNLSAVNARGKVEALKLRAENAMQDSKESGQSWTNGGHEKIIMEGTGSREENAAQADQNSVDKTGEAASKATNTINYAAQGSSRYASEKVGEATNMAYRKVTDAYDDGLEKLDMASDKASGVANDADVMMAEVMGHGGSAFYEVFYMASDAVHGFKESIGGVANYGRDKAVDAYNLASDVLSDKLSHLNEVMEEAENGGEHSQWTSNLVSDWASQKAGDAQDMITDVLGHGQEMADYAYDHATHKANEVPNNEAKDKMDDEEERDKVGEAYTTARESTAYRLKENYGAAKEKMSQATGDLGARMGKDIADT